MKQQNIETQQTSSTVKAWLVTGTNTPSKASAPRQCVRTPTHSPDVSFELHRFPNFPGISPQGAGQGSFSSTRHYHYPSGALYAATRARSRSQTHIYQNSQASGQPPPLGSADASAGAGREPGSQWPAARGLLRAGLAAPRGNGRRRAPAAAP